VKRARLVRTGQEEVCFQCEDMSIRKQGEGLIPREIISCHSEDEIRRISISWETNANPCDSSLCSERQVLCHTALDAVSHKYSAFTSSPCDCGSESAMTIPILPLEVGATHVENFQAGRGSFLRRDFVMLNLFQHLTSLACSLFINKILKQVQDDAIRNFRNELFNPSTLQPFNPSTIQLKICWIPSLSG